VSASVTSTIAMPGGISHHHQPAESAPALNDSSMMRPQEIVLGSLGDERERDALLARPLEPLTGATITDPRRLHAVLDETRRRGFALSVGELEDGLVTIAAPVVADGRAVAAISCSGPTFRIAERDHARLARLVVDAAAAVGHRAAGRSR
jgi:DNA-binding IclR family transcriptional regulator